MIDTAVTPCPQLETLEQMHYGRLAPTGRDEMMRHLAGCQTCRAALDAVARNERLLGRLSTALAGEGGAPVLPVGRLDIPGYIIEGELHRGGQGIVFAGRQCSTNRRVAIKVILHGTYASPRELARFKREVDLVAQVRHPGVVTVYDSGITVDGRLYLVMERIDGVALDVGAAAGWAIERTLELFVRICDTVDAAHRLGVLHRDIKPSNVLIDDSGAPLLLDFGLATSREHMLKVEDEDGPRVTRTGTFFGTIAYAAPEQLRGARDEIDARCDVYALGAMLFEMLTGVLPHPLEGGPFELLERFRRGQVPRPSSLRRDVGPELDTIIAKTLSPDPSRRYATAGQLAEDVRRLLAGQPISARRATASYRLRKFAARNRALAATIVGSFVVLLVALIVVVALLLRAVQAETLAQSRRAASQQEAAKAEAYSAFLTRMLVSADPDVARGRDTSILREMLDEFAERSRIELEALPEVRASVQRTLGETYASLGLHEKAVELLSASADLYAELYGKDDPRRAEILIPLAYAHHYLSDLDAAERGVREAIAILTRTHRGDHPDVADARVALAQILITSGQTSSRGLEARQIAETALEVLRVELGPDHERTLEALIVYGRVLLEVGALDDAERVLREAAERRIAMYGPGSLEAATGALLVGRLLLRRERFAEAEPLLLSGVDLRRRLLGPDHFALAWPLEHLARLRVHQQRYDEAEALAVEALEIYRRHLGEDDPQVLIARADVAGVLIAAARHEEALRILEKILPPLRATLGPDNDFVRRQEARLEEAAVRPPSSPPARDTSPR